jgi:hypothetical protein
MKLVSVLFSIALMSVLVSCESKARYVDVNTGKELDLVKDESSGLMVEAGSKKPVYMYVDTKNNDTIYGSTGKVVNGQVVKTNDGGFKFTGDYEYKSADGNLKVEVERDGDIKIKDGDNKIKIDGETGEKKVKKD